MWSGSGRLLPMFSAELAFLLLLKIWSTWLRMNSITSCCTRTSRKAASPLQPTASISLDLHEEREVPAVSIATHSPWQGQTRFLPASKATGMISPLLLYLFLSFPHRPSSSRSTLLKIIFSDFFAIPATSFPECVIFPTWLLHPSAGKTVTLKFHSSSFFLF